MSFDERLQNLSRFVRDIHVIVLSTMAVLAINAAVHDKPAKEKLEFFGNSLFIPLFFIVTGFLIDPLAFYQSITTNFPLVSAVIGALLVGKWIAAQIVGRAFAYTPAARMTMWSLTLPQVGGRPNTRVTSRQIHHKSANREFMSDQTDHAGSVRPRQRTCRLRAASSSW